MSLHLEKVKVNCSIWLCRRQWILWVAYMKHKITQRLSWHLYSVGSNEKTPVAEDVFYWCQGSWCAKRNI